MEEVPTWLTRIGFKDTNKKKIVTTCEDIAKLDETFIFSIVRYMGNYNYDWMLIIKSPSQDHAYKRGAWFRYKVIEGLTYSVVEQ